MTMPACRDDILSILSSTATLKELTKGLVSELQQLQLQLSALREYKNHENANPFPLSEATLLGHQSFQEFQFLCCVFLQLVMQTILFVLLFFCLLKFINFFLQRRRLQRWLMVAAKAHDDHSGQKLEELDEFLGYIEEQRQVLLALKLFEEDFFHRHNRTVHSLYDVMPVLDQYRRYKELKRIIAKFNHQLQHQQ